MKKNGKTETPEAAPRTPSPAAMFSEWMQQGTETFFASQRILLDLVMRQNAMAMGAVAATSLATYSGKVVTWDEGLNSKLSLLPQRMASDATPPVVPAEDGPYPVAPPGATKAF